MTTNRSITGRRSRPKGYVLLVVLAVTVLVFTVLGKLADVSLKKGLQAADAQRHLQQRWGTQTLQRALLRQAPKLFEAQADASVEIDPTVPPPTTIRAAIRIGPVTYDLLLGDEDSKLNLNSIYHHTGKEKTAELVQEATPSLARVIRLSPVVKPLELSRESRQMTLAGDADDEAKEVVPDAFRSWGEVFDIARLERQSGGPAALPAVTTGITCWGSGQLNFRRATDNAILAVVGSVVQDGGAQRILERYRKNATMDITSLIHTEVKNEANRRELMRLLSDSSQNFSLWIHASTGGGEPLQRFVVMRLDDEGVTRYQQFAH